MKWMKENVSVIVVTGQLKTDEKDLKYLQLFRV